MGGVQFAMNEGPKFWTTNDTKSTPLLATFDQANSEVIMKPYPEFVKQVEGLTNLYIETTKGNSKAVPWTPQFLYGATVNDPYIVATKDKPAAKLYVALEEGS